VHGPHFLQNRLEIPVARYSDFVRNLSLGESAIAAGQYQNGGKGGRQASSQLSMAHVLFKF
jgi:hypothetical protein